LSPAQSLLSLISFKTTDVAAGRPSKVEIIADNLSKAGWSYGYVSAVDSNGRTIWIADAHRGYGRRYVVHADEKLTAFLELERAICIPPID
jgi:hypothetical protein